MPGPPIIALFREGQLPEKGASGNGVVSYSNYDARGHARRIIDGPSDLTFAFDRAERLVSVQETGGYQWPLKLFEYDTLGGVPQGASLGKLVRSTAHNHYDPSYPASDFIVEHSMAYGGLDGRPSSRTTVTTILGYNQATFTQSFTYDPLGAVATLTYPQLASVGPSRTITYTYTQGMLTKVSEGSTDLASSISYHPNGMVNQVAHKNSATVTVTDTHGKDPHDMQRPASITVARGGTTLWSTGTYTYDSAGNIRAIGSETFVYDLVSRLKEGKISSGGSKRQCAAYDAFGNITGLGTTSFTYCSPSPISVSSWTNRMNAPVTYDSAGNVTAWGSLGYDWYPTGMLDRTRGGTIYRETYHGYDADGERILTYDTGVGTLTYTLRDLGGKVLREYRFDDVAKVWSWQKDYVYYPFGTEASNAYADTERMKFTGHERDLRDTSNTTDDLDYMHARYYNPNVARFLSTDPVTEVRKAMRQPQRWNRYAYAVNNPIVYTDPTGETVYLVTYTTGNSSGDDEFKRAAYTRAIELRKAKGFDPKKDRVLVRGVGTKQDLVGALKEAASLEKTFGKIGEFSLFSHADAQLGPMFHDQSGQAAAFSPGELGTFKGNWAAGASARFYGCNTSAFAQSFANSQGLRAYGYTDYTLFSSAPGRFTYPNETGPLYLILTEGGLTRTFLGLSSDRAIPMEASDPWE